MTDNWFENPCPPLDQAAIEKARAHQLNLTKPPGSLGRLEDIAVSFCGWQHTRSPNCDKIQIVVFAGDHGVCQQGVSAFPQEVTAQMVLNFAHGGSAINVLADQLNADFRVVNMGLVSTLDDLPSLVNQPITDGTSDFTIGEAMSQQTLQTALEMGRTQVADADLFIGGDMGIGNTSAASAIYSLLLDLLPEVTVGPGTGVDEAGIKRKQEALNSAIRLHQSNVSSALDVLRCVGGLEIAGLCGAYIAAAQRGVPVLVDGFIATAAALLAARINPSSRDWMLFAHRSAEPAHYHALEALDAEPLLDLGMRLGEGSGAAVAVSLIQNALALHNRMATFADAGVSEA